MEGCWLERLPDGLGRVILEFCGPLEAAAASEILDRGVGTRRTRFESEWYLDAVKSGNFELLKWLRAEGCPWHVGIYSEAIVPGTRT